MRIISKFHDYYDSIQGYGFDPTVVFIRKRKEIHIHDLSKNIPIAEMASYPSHPSFRPQLDGWGELYFCGKRYRFIRTFEENKINLSKRYKFFYSYKIINNYILKYNKKDVVEKYILRNFRRYRKYRNTSQKTLESYFTFNDIFEHNVLLHEKFNTPVFVIHNSNYEPNLIINPSLKDYQFQKIFDPYTAFQEIDMFLSGVMKSPENKMVQIGDEVMRDKKGFDYMSFKPKMREKHEMTLKRNS